jgi:hypothetical protein
MCLTELTRRLCHSELELLFAQIEQLLVQIVNRLLY